MLGLLAYVCGTVNGARAGVSLDLEPYLRDPWIHSQVQFWVDVFARYDSDQAVLHDAADVRRVYEVVDLRGCKRKCRLLRVLGARRKWKALLSSVHQKVSQSTDPTRPPSDLTSEERQVFALFSDSPDPSRFAEALRKKRMRMQLGQRNRFIEAIRESRKYMDMMEKVFREEGVPVELTRIPFVESGFSSRALSKVGATGIWQLMPSTGRNYLDVTPGQDQRRNAEFSTRAAARLLKDNFTETGSWPLAVVAYNHGRKGMLRAVREIGTDDVRAVIQQFRSRSFGFASRNYFVEFLAAFLVEKNHSKYFSAEITARGGR